MYVYTYRYIFNYCKYKKAKKKTTLTSQVYYDLKLEFNFFFNENRQYKHKELESFEDFARWYFINVKDFPLNKTKLNYIFSFYIACCRSTEYILCVYVYGSQLITIIYCITVTSYPNYKTIRDDTVAITKIY